LGKAIGRPRRTVSLSISTLLISLLQYFSYLAARLEVFSLGKDTLVVVDVVLPAVLGLVLVRKAGVEAWRFVSE